MSKVIGHCRGCGRALDRDAKKCPKCGLSNPVPRSHFVRWTLLLLVVIAAVSLLILTLQTPDRPPTRSPVQPQTRSADEGANAPATPTTPAVPGVPGARIEAAPQPGDQYDGPARRAAHAFILNQLEVPQSASFSEYDDTIVEWPQDGPLNQRRVQGYVESQDLLGNKTRKRFDVVVEFPGGNPRSSSVVSSVVE